MFSNILNQCWLKKHLGEEKERFKFLLYEDDSGKMLAENEDEISQNIETVVKKLGFLKDEIFVTPSNFTLECQEDGLWEYVDFARCILINQE